MIKLKFGVLSLTPLFWILQEPCSELITSKMNPAQEVKEPFMKAHYVTVREFYQEK